MPIPAKRRSAIDIFQPTLHGRQRGVSGQIDLQRGHRNKALVDSVEIRSGSGILLCASGTDPVYGSPARIPCRNDGLGAMAVAESARTKATKLVEGDVGHVDVEDQT